MISYPLSLQAVGGARTAIAPVNLLDVLDVNGNLYFWSDRRCTAPIVVTGAVAPSGAAPPITIPPNQFVAWAVPLSVAVTPDAPNESTVAFAANPTASVNASATLVRTGMNPAEEGWRITQYALWSGFSAPTLPPGAIVTGIYPVMLASAPARSSDSYLGLIYGNGLSISDLGVVSGTSYNLTNPDYTVGGTFPEVQWQGATSLGTDLSVLSTLDVVATLQSSLLYTALDECDVQFVGLAIYYETGGRVISEPFQPGVAPGTGTYKPWLLTIPALTFHRSSVTDVGSFTLQNLSGDTRARDFEKILRSSALEGAFFVYRCYQADAQAPWIEVHGQLTVEDVGVDTVTLKGAPAVNPADTDTPTMEYCETCQWRWSSDQCGATGDTECQYSYQTCQVLERIEVVLNDYEKNYGETTANVPTQTTNRARRF